MLGGASYRQLRAQFPARPGRPALYRAGRRRFGRTRQDDHRRGIARPQRASYRREPCDARPALPAFGRNPPRRPPAPDAIYGGADEDRKSVVSGKSVSVRVDLGGRGIIKKIRKERIDKTTSALQT